MEKSPPATQQWKTSGLAGKARVWKLGGIKFTPQLLSYLMTSGWLFNLPEPPLPHLKKEIIILTLKGWNKQKTRIKAPSTKHGVSPSPSMSVSSSWREFFGRPQIGPVLDWLSFPTDAQLFPWKHQLLSSWGFSLHLSDWDSFSYIPCLPLPWFTFSFQYYLQEGCVGNAFFVTSRT